MEIRELTIRTYKFQQKTHFSLLPFGDLQVGSALFNKQVWADYVEAVKKAQNPITIGMGDYSDHFRPSVRERLTSALGGYDAESLKSLQALHREFLDKHVLPRLKEVVKNSSCLGLLAGHHDMDYADGTNSTQYLCNKLGVTYLGRGEALVRVNLILGGRNADKQLNFDLFATHGEGAGQSIGTPIRKLQQILSYFDVDIALRGHSCDKFIQQEPQFSLTRTHPPRLRERNRIIANTGGFSTSRIVGEDTYVERSNMMPKALGWVEIHIHVRRDWSSVDKSLRGKSRERARVNRTQYLQIGD